MLTNPCGSVSIDATTRNRRVHFEDEEDLDDLDTMDVLITVIGQGTTVPAPGLHKMRRFTGATLAEIQACDDAINKDGCAFSEITIEAIPAAGWMLRRWHGDTRLATGNTVTVDLQVPRAVTVEFVQRPGMDTLDLSADFQAFLTGIGQGGAYETYDRYGWGWGEDGEPVAVGNGIPDVAELVLLEFILKDYNLDLSARNGVAHDPVWDAWQRNLAYVEVTYPNATVAVGRAYGALLTLGGKSGRVLVEDLGGLSIPANGAVALGRAKFLEGTADADNDGVSNAAEWRAVTDAMPQETFSGKLLRFTENALDGNSSSADEGGGEGAETPPACEETACLYPVSVVHGLAVSPDFVVPHSNITVSGAGFKLTSKNETAYPYPGSKISISAEDQTGEDPYWFILWAAKNSLADGSLNRVESDFSLVHNGMTSYSALYYRYATKIPENGPTDEIHYQLSGGTEVVDALTLERYLVGEYGQELSIAAWLNPALQTAANRRIKQINKNNNGIRYYGESATAMIGGNVSATATSDPEPELRFTIGASAEQGGKVVVGGTHGWEGAYLGAVSLDAYRVEETGEEWSYSPVTVEAMPNTGFRFTHWTDLPPAGDVIWWPGTVLPEYSPDLTFTPNGSFTLTAHFEEIPGYQLKVDVAGNGCNGWVEVDKDYGAGIRRYYHDGDTIKLTAKEPEGSCCWYFDHWEGEGFTTGGAPVQHNWDKTIYLKFNKYTIADGAMEIRAVFYDGSEESSEGGTVYYDRPGFWGSIGKQGDRFYNTITAGAVAGWSWDGVEIGEKMCYVGDSLGGITDMAQNIKLSGTGKFVVEAGSKTMSAGASCETTVTGLWLIGKDGGDSDEHSLNSNTYSDIRDHFDEYSEPVTVDFVQTYYIKGKGNNSKNYPKRHIARFPISVSFYRLIAEATCYSGGFNAHWNVNKGGAEHPCANGFTGSFWSGYYSAPENACSCVNGQCGGVYSESN